MSQGIILPNWWFRKVSSPELITLFFLINDNDDDDDDDDSESF
jgi:hypothetical protein